jgi:hypothetical protein
MIWGIHGGDYEECHLLGYKNPVHTSHETHYVSVTESSQLMVCKIWAFHGGDYEECRLLGCKNSVLTSQKTQYIPDTETGQLTLCKICLRLEDFDAVTVKNAVFWDVTLCGSCKNWSFGGTNRYHYGVDKNQQAKKTLAVSSNWRKFQKTEFFKMNFSLRVEYRNTVCITQQQYCSIILQFLSGHLHQNIAFKILFTFPLLASSLVLENFRGALT